MAEADAIELDLIAVGAHPDDVEIACGGTLARLVQKGYRVGIVDLTDGEPTPGSPGPDVRLEEARREAVHQWRHGVLAGEAMWDLRRPQDFDAASDHATAEILEGCLPISDDLGRHAADIAALLALDATVHLHCVGRNQEAFIDSFGSKVLPQLG